MRQPSAKNLPTMQKIQRPGFLGILLLASAASTMAGEMLTQTERDRALPEFEASRQAFLDATRRAKGPISYRMMRRNSNANLIRFDLLDDVCNRIGHTVRTRSQGGPTKWS